jgi:Na+/melibiose symporter-like transporter
LIISFFVALARAVEILLKPIIAHLSDTATFKMGRRKPFMLMGCFFYAIFLIFIFAPPSHSMTSTNTSVWFGVFYVLFFIADTICNIPYAALGPELSSESSEREKLYIVFYSFNYLGVLFAAAAPVLINKFFQNCPCTECDIIIDLIKQLQCKKECKLLCNLRSNENSLLYISMFIGAFFIVSIIVLSLKIDENVKSYNQEEKVYIVPTFFRILNKAFDTVLSLRSACV